MKHVGHVFGRNWEACLIHRETNGIELELIFQCLPRVALQIGVVDRDHQVRYVVSGGAYSTYSSVCQSGVNQSVFSTKYLKIYILCAANKFFSLSHIAT